MTIRTTIRMAGPTLVLIGVMAGLVQGQTAPPGGGGVKDFGGTGDGTTLNTAAFEKAIASCEKAGGGTVYVPPGKYLTGTIALKSHVTLHLDAGARILASQKPQDYLQVEDVWFPGRKET